jgi:hypothetical protein
MHAGAFRGIMDAILATRSDTADGPRYAVLSVTEQYFVLTELGLESQGQALVQGDTGPQDCHRTAEGRICFDISAFFGR